jgi:hypothetical protein
MSTVDRNKFLGRPVRYISVVPGQSSETAFICRFIGQHDDNLHADILVFDESKKQLLSSVLWYQGFRRVHDVPHLSQDTDKRRQHCFDFLDSESGDDIEVNPAPKAVVPEHAQVPDYPTLRKQLGDYESTFYGPHACAVCGVEIVKKAIEQGGEEYELAEPGLEPPYQSHIHKQKGRKPSGVTVDGSQGGLGAGSGAPSGADLDAIAKEEAAKAATAGS